MSRCGEAIRMAAISFNLGVKERAEATRISTDTRNRSEAMKENGPVLQEQQPGRT